MINMRNTNSIERYSPMGIGVIGKQLEIEGNFQQNTVSRVQIGDQILKTIFQSDEIVKVNLPMFPVEGPLIVIFNGTQEVVLENEFKVVFGEKMVSPSRDLLYKFKNNPWS
jgi:hypothetical protein